MDARIVVAKHYYPRFSASSKCGLISDRSNSQSVSAVLELAKPISILGVPIRMFAGGAPVRSCKLYAMARHRARCGEKCF
jgi:hypothetical protein